MENVFLLLTVSAIGVMVYALIWVISLNKKMPGGMVGSSWKILTILIVLFTARYLTTPFFPVLPEMLKLMIVSIIFLFGAIFVVIVINLFYKVIKEIGFS
ncbi:MAG: hypothetical protein JSV13_03800 [Nitrospiraceae bacterium]|jgi:hypothetical protein|nr:MAG: hypothetical protein JSV13_03800 [Nitrospiraceae bacterium]